MLKAKGTKINNSGSHTLFIGSSGTKKTETARIYGDILYGLGLIKENKILEVSKEDLVSPYIGETEVKTKEILQRAKGGVLFVDEAYTLANDSTNQGNDYGKIALEFIMRAMENDRENLVVIFAGFEK
jgi:AAA+ superfamily predicted ATPase